MRPLTYEESFTKYPLVGLAIVITEFATTTKRKKVKDSPDPIFFIQKL